MSNIQTVLLILGQNFNKYIYIYYILGWVARNYIKTVKLWPEIGSFTYTKQYMIPPSLPSLNNPYCHSPDNNINSRC